MGKLIVFNSISLDGFFMDSKADMSFAYNPVPDAEWEAFVAGNASGGGTLVFGRVTYQMMAAYWPSPAALKATPDVARGINAAPKVVFSRTLRRADWNNSRIATGELASEIRGMKKDTDMAVLGSGTIVSRLAQEGLVDELQCVVVPVIIGSGRTMFDGVTRRIGLKLVQSRAFHNGNVLLRYAPA